MIRAFVPFVLGGALLGALASGAAAQHTLFINMDSDQPTISNGNGNVSVGLCGEDEVYAVNPVPGSSYSAEPFLSRAAQWALLGDADADGRFADDSELAPGGDIDALFLKAGTVGPVGMRDIYVSKEGNTGFAASVEDGDVFRYAGPLGAIEFFITEAQIRNALGTASTSIDTDAICQNAAGDIFFSVSLAISGLIDDGDLAMIPAATITYDGLGNVSATTAASAIIVATEAEMFALVGASGFRTSVGGTASSSFDLSALEIDPTGGTWTPASSGLTIDNVLFGWEGFSNDGGIISSAGGGTIPSINGVPMASALATQGDQVGLLPDSTGIFGYGGMALAPQQAHQLVVENYPVDLHTATSVDYSWHRVEVAGATPFSTCQLVAGIGPVGPGGAVSSFPFAGGELFLGGGFLLLFAIVTDDEGFGQVSFLIPPNPALPGSNIVFQVIQLPVKKVSTPAAVQFI